MDARSPASAPTHEPAAVSASAERDRLVCVVDDDTAVRDSVSVLLETIGFEVLAYASGAEFLADKRHRTASCLIIDQHMPGMNGLDVVRMMHASGLNIPAVLVTGRLDPAVAGRAGEIGVTAILEKPFAIARLTQLVCDSLGQKQ